MTDSHTYPRDFFLYLLTTVTLYVSVISGLMLLFQFINLGFPDPLDYAEGVRGSIRWGAAMLTILFPVFAFTTRFLHRDLVHFPEKAEYRIRKWLLYLTVFVAALVVIGDLITLLFNFLNGDLTIRFLLKILAVGLVTGLVFGYELWDVRRTDFQATSGNRTISWSLAGVVVVVIVAGFTLSGSPFEQRRVRFDEQRLSDLQNIQYQVIEYWIAKQALPATLTDVQSPLVGFVLPTDPNTHEAYGYNKLAALKFSLCATFDTTSQSANRNRNTYPLKEGTMDFWDHGTGNVCFERTIDPDLYKDRQAKPMMIEPAVLR
ncbi:MAG: DUF5671 domain-containing protein [Candidatus Peribacteraceae bacterium]|nr:DUF5671 domain-containing protein [Candidatus Peribacteraceae bacterium]MDD5742934.1 DUF5671 domain-containing protein [Candidatus Peribacteraceae bacterium]